MLMRVPLKICAIVVACLALPSSKALHAAVLAYEGFDYGPLASDVSGNGGGFGFGSAWTLGGFNASNFRNYDVGAGSLTFGSLQTSGNHARSNSVGSIAGLTRSLSEPLGAANTTRYLSFLLRPEGTLHQGAFNGFFGIILERTGEPELFAGKPGGGSVSRYVLENRGGASQFASNLTTAIDQTTLLVIKAEFTAGQDRFTLYTNPTPGAAEPAAGTNKNNINVGTVTGLTIYSTGAFGIDEIRVGETFADVTPFLLPGDYNGSGVVEQGDLDLVLLNWGTDAGDPPRQGSGDFPFGIVDQSELDRVLLNWGNRVGGPPMPGAAVVGLPEPATCWILLMSAGWLLLTSARLPRTTGG